MAIGRRDNHEVHSPSTKTVACFVTLGLACTLLALFCVSSAKAVVHVDPNGPAGQQYALPIDTVRGEVSGDELAGVPGAQSEPAPLFGEGIRPEETRSVNDRTDKEYGAASRGQRPDRQAGSGHASSATIEEAIAALTQGGDTDSSFPPGMAVVIAGMLLLGLGAGWLGRRAL